MIQVLNDIGIGALILLGIAAAVVLYAFASWMNAGSH
jgi:hypothetical protein